MIGNNYIAFIVICDKNPAISQQSTRDPRQLHAIRVGDWKLFLDRQGAFGQSKHNSAELNQKFALLRKEKGPALFHLSEDPNEMIDLSTKYPEKVKEMQALAEERLEEIKRNIVPLTD